MNKVIKIEDETVYVGKGDNGQFTAISRKSFNEKIFGLSLEERLMGTLMFESLMVQDGGRILRVHDVKETRDILNMLEVYNKF